jgi:large subunit ribosomal protein L35
MPKMKTKRSAAKRLKKTASGKLMRHKGWKSHLLETKSPRRRRRLRQPHPIAKADERRMKALVPYL